MRFKNFLIFLIFHSLFLFGQIKTQYIQNSSVSPSFTKKINFSFSEIKLGKTGDFDSVIIDDCELKEFNGFIIPCKTITFEIEGEYEIYSVNLVNYKTFNIERKINLARTKETKIINEFVPGNFLASGSAENRGKTLISVLIYPFQYNPLEEKGIFLKEGEIEIRYGKNIQKLTKSPVIKSPGFYAEVYPEVCLIITPEKYIDIANTIKFIHENQSGIGTPVSTRVVTTEYIMALRYGEANQPPLADFPDSLCPDGGYKSKTGTDYPNRETRLRPRYNEVLARKILSFLLDLADAPGYYNPDTPPHYGDGYFHGPNLQYILILGNAMDVPPSYYVHLAFSEEGTDKDTYNAWVPTDYFYACCGKNGLTSLNPYFSVGRIPVPEIYDILYQNLIVASVDSANRRITASLNENPGDLSGKAIVMRSGSANGRVLDIESSSWASNILTIILKPGSNMEGIAVNDRFDIVDPDTKVALMQQIANKIGNWVGNINSDQSYFKNISFAGGKSIFVETKWKKSPGVLNSGYVSTFYWDELSCLEVINSIDKVEEGGDNKSYVSGLGVKKYFESNLDKNLNKISNQDYGFLKSDVVKILKNEQGHENGIFYYAGEGFTLGLSFPDGFLNSLELLSYSSTTRNNIFISHAPDTGVYDLRLWYGGQFDPFLGFGIATLLSPACSIAYFGPVRGNGFKLNWSVDEKGILNFSHEYTNELTRLIIKKYHRTKGGLVKIRDIITEAQREFWIKNQSNWTPYHFRTLVQFNLFGDPALYIPGPQYPVSEYTNLPSVECLNFDRVNSDNFSVYEVEDNSQREVKVNFGSESENVKITLVDPRWFTADECYIKTSTGTQSFWFDDKDEGKDDTTNGPGLYFAKIEQKEMGVDYYTKEIRIYFEIVNKFIPEGDILLIDDDQPRRYTTYPNDPWYQSEVYSGFPHYPDVESYYEEALQGLGINRVDMGGTGKKYKVWHVENKDGSNASGQGRHGEVTYEILSNYIGEGKLVIWFTGNDWLTTIKQKEQEAITQFLNNGGRLFITGQDIGYNLSTASPAFYRNILKSTLVQDNIRLFDIDGINIDDLSGELKDINITSGDGAYNQHWPSEIDPQVGASTILLYDPAGAGGGSRMSSGTAGIRYYDQNTGGALVYFAFGFEAINNFEGQSNGRKAVLEKVINYLSNPTPSGLFKAVAGDQKIYLYWLWPNQRDTNILILYKEQTGYPTGIPQNGQTYTKGQQIGDGIVEFVGSFPTTSYEHTGLVNDRTYYYAAYVYDTATKTYKLLGYANATPRAGSEPGEIPKPTNLTATPRYIENINMWVVDLSWQDNSEDEYEEDGFAIERKIDDGDFQEIKRVGRDTTSYTDDNDGSGLEENRTYTYRVRAYKGMQYSKYSNEATTMTVRPGKPIPVSPKNQINVPLTPQLVAQYEHPLGLPLVGSAWQIRKQDGTIVYNVESGAQTTHQVPPGILQFNTDYWWRVRFRDANWWSDWSDEAYFKTRGNSPPNKPSCISPKNVTGISITPTLRSSTFTDPDGDNIKYAKWYIREDNNGSPGNIKWQGQNSPNPNSPSITVPPNILQYETKYWWSVQYSDIFDAWSEEADYVWFITETPPPPQPPYKPQNISVDGKTYNGAENISLTPTLKASPFSDPNPNDIFSDSHWQIAVVNDKNQDGSYREVYWEKYGGATNTIKVDNPPLQPNTKYYWHVRYKDSTGLWSEWSDEWYFITGSGTEGGEVGGGGGCFIASVCFGEDSWQVKVLREFRDRILIKSYPGKKFVSFYYRNSPKIADFIKGKKFIFYAVRISLYPLIFLVILILYGILPYLIFISGILLLLKSLLKNTLRK